MAPFTRRCTAAVAAGVALLLLPLLAGASAEAGLGFVVCTPGIGAGGGAMPGGKGICRHSGSSFNNRPLYGNHNGLLVLAGDMPLAKFG